jgi:flagellar biosynthesis protein FlhG
MANINYPQKLKLIRFLKSLSARYILLDLSAGTAFNTLDLFQLGRYGIVVTTPEYPALMSALVFVKNLTLRAINEVLRSDKSLQNKLAEMHKQSVSDPVFTIRKFRNDIDPSHPESAQKIDEICARIRPRFVYNMVESAEDAEQFANVDTTCADVLSIECDHIGLVPYDSEVRHFLKKPGVFMTDRSDTVTAKTIDRIGRRIVNLWDSPMEGSAALLTAYAQEVFSDDPSSGVAGAAGSR